MSDFIHVPEHTFGLTNLWLGFRQGSLADADGMAGSTELGLEWLLRGTKAQDKVRFHRRLDGLGSSLHVHVSDLETWIELECLDAHLAPSLDLLASALCAPALHQRHFKEVRQEMMHDRRGLLDGSDSTAGLFLRRALYRGHPWRQYPGGEFSRGFDAGPKQVKERLHQLLATNNLFCVVQKSEGVGDGLAPGMTIDQVERWFSELKGSLASPCSQEVIVQPKVQEPVHLILPRNDAAVAHVRWAWVPQAGWELSIEQRRTLWLAAWALGGSFLSALVQTLREQKGWAYDVSCSYRLLSPYRSPFVLSTDVQVEHLPMLNAFFSEQGPLGLGVLKQHHIEHAIAHLHKAIPLWFAEPSYRMLVRTMQLLTGHAFFEPMMAWLADCDPTSIFTEIQDLFQHGGLSSVIVAPETALDTLKHSPFVGKQYRVQPECALADWDLKVSADAEPS